MSEAEKPTQRKLTGNSVLTKLHAILLHALLEAEVAEPAAAKLAVRIVDEVDQKLAGQNIYFKQGGSGRGRRSLNESWHLAYIRERIELHFPEANITIEVARQVGGLVSESLQREFSGCGLYFPMRISERLRKVEREIYEAFRSGESVVDIAIRHDYSLQWVYRLIRVQHRLSLEQKTGQRVRSPRFADVRRDLFPEQVAKNRSYAVQRVEQRG